MQAREQLFLEKDEIVKLVCLFCCQNLKVSLSWHFYLQTLVTIQVEWKLTRGKWRPKLLDYAKHASEEEVVGTTKKAFACLGSAETPALPEVEEALKELISLKASTSGASKAVTCRLQAGRQMIMPIIDLLAQTCTLQAGRQMIIDLLAQTNASDIFA